MAEQIFGFNRVNTARIVKATRKSEREPPPPGNQRPRQRPPWTPWKAFKNTSGETAPSYGIIAITGREFPSEHAPSVLTGTKPSDTFRLEYRINSSIPVEEDQYGSCMSLGLDAEVLYDDSNAPAFGEVWGPVPNTWLIAKGYPGLFIVGGVTGTGALARVTAHSDLIQHIRGKTDAAIAKGASGTVSMYIGTAGSMSDSTVNISSVYNPYANVAITKWVLVTWVNGGPELAAAEC